jgi:hypothetical protein
MQRMCVKHEWLSNCLNWTASGVREFGNDIPAITRKAVERLGDGDEERQRGNPAAEVAPSISVGRAATE